MGFPIQVPGGLPFPDEPQYPSFPRCEHQRVDVRKRRQSNNVLVAVRQCVTCGANCGAVRKDSLQTVTGLPEWDDDLQKTYRETVAADWEAKRNAAAAARNRQWWEWYNDYLNSPKWHAKRAAVLKRDNYVCRGCGTNRAVQVHHLDYKRVGKEMLFDLVSICLECHNAIHEQGDRDE